MAEAQEPPRAAPPASSEKSWLGFLRPGGLLHSALWTERTGATLAVVISVFSFVVSLHGIEAWPTMLILALAAFWVIVAAWYPSAQSNAVQQAIRNEGSIDAQQVNRDFGWSILPTVPIGISAILTVVAVVLIVTHTHVFDDERSWVLRDRMIMSPAMAFINVIVLWMVKVDIGNNNTILTEMAQLAGRLTRFERAH